jgi:hypothetical protein
MEMVTSGISNWSLNPDDTDGDGIPNFLDVDDEWYGTKLKLRTKLLSMVLVQRMDTTRIAEANDDPLTQYRRETRYTCLHSSFKNIRLYDGRKNKSSS